MKSKTIIANATIFGNQNQNQNQNPINISGTIEFNEIGNGNKVLIKIDLKGFPKKI